MSDCGVPWGRGPEVQNPVPGSGEDRMYGRRVRAFIDPFAAWNPSLKDICEQGSVSVTSGQQNQVLVSYAVPKGRIAYIQGFGQEALCGAFTEATWRIMVGSGVWTTIQPIAQVGSFLWPFPLHIFATGGTIITVTGSLPAGNATRALGAMLRGVERNPDDSIPQEMA